MVRKTWMAFLLLSVLGGPCAPGRPTGAGPLAPARAFASPSPRTSVSPSSSVLVLASAESPGAHADDSPAWRLHAQGIEAIDREDYARAIELLSEAIRLDPKLAAAWMARGYAQGELGQLERAVADYDEAIRLDPQDAEAWCNRGFVRAKLRQWPEALADLNAAIRLDAELAEAWHSRGWVHVQLGQYDQAAADYGEALRLGEDDAYLRFDRATCRLMLGQYAEAIEDLDRAIRLDPNDLRFHGARGAARLWIGQYEPGIADLAKAIAMNPRDAGRDYQPWKKTPLSAEAMAHGRRQVERMLRDRPRMADHGGATGFLREWAARKFAGEDLGVTIDWDPSEPRDSDAENVAPGPGRRGRIRVARMHQWGANRGQPRSFEQLWSNAVFELHNIAHGAEILKLHDEAERGTISKEHFVEGIWNHEHRAAQETRAFYVRVYAPWAARQKLKTDPALWFAALWQEADETFDGFTDRASYPWRPYARQYDWATVRRLQREGKLAEAVALLETMAPQAEYPQDAPHVWVMIGRYRLQLHQPDAAVAALSRAIELAPDDPEAYRLRAEAYEALGQLDKARADAQRARQFDR